MGRPPVRIEAGLILLFARAVGDPNPIYYDSDYANHTETHGVIAPPTFIRAVPQLDASYELYPKTSGSISPDRSPEYSGAVLAEEHHEYLRPLRPGDTLTIESFPGNNWEKMGRRGTVLRFAELVSEYRDQMGDVVARVRSVRVTTQDPQ